MKHPQDGTPLTEAEIANVVTRFHEAGLLWESIGGHALATVAITSDPHEALMTIGVQVAKDIGDAVPKDIENPDHFVIGLLIGVIAVAAMDGAIALNIARGGSHD